jgi:hypothetical protein
MKEEEKNSKLNKDLAYVMHNTTFTWIKNFFIDLKRNSMVSSFTYVEPIVYQDRHGYGVEFQIVKAEFEL